MVARKGTRENPLLSADVMPAIELLRLAHELDHTSFWCFKRKRKLRALYEAKTVEVDAIIKSTGRGACSVYKTGEQK